MSSSPGSNPHNEVIPTNEQKRRSFVRTLQKSKGAISEAFRRISSSFDNTSCSVCLASSTSNDSSHSSTSSSLPFSSSQPCSVLQESTKLLTVREQPVMSLDVDEETYGEELDDATLHRISAAVLENSSLILPLAKIVTWYLEDTVILASCKDKSLEFVIRSRHLSAQSPVMEMKLNFMEPIYILECSPRVLHAVVLYVTSHKTKCPPIISKPLRSPNMKDVSPCQWDAWFIDLIGTDKQLLYDLILFANAINIRALLHLGCAKVASLVKGQPLGMIANILAVAPVAPPLALLSTVAANVASSLICADIEQPQCSCEYH